MELGIRETIMPILQMRDMNQRIEIKCKKEDNI